MAFYVLLADDTEKGYESDRDWHPKLYPYMQTGANVLLFTFIHPETMEVPPAFVNLAKTRGTGEEGAVPKDTVILFALGKILTVALLFESIIVIKIDCSIDSSATNAIIFYRWIRLFS